MARSITVLYVDGEPDAVDDQVVLDDGGNMTVETARDVSEGLDLLADDDVVIDCVVSSYELPHRTGIEFLEDVRDTHPELPFVLYTENGSEAVASDAITAGVTDYLQKDRTDGHARVVDRVRTLVEEYREDDVSTSRPAKVYERISDGFFAVNTDWRYTYVNEKGARLVGEARDDLLGERVWDVFPDLTDTRFSTALRRAMSTQESVSIEEYYPDHEAWYDVTVYPTANGISIYFRDVTDKQRQLRQLETLIENLPGMVYRCANEPGWPMEDIRGDVEELTGYSSAIVKTRSGFYGDNLIHPTDRDQVWETVQAALDERRSFELTYRIVTRDGTTKWVWERGQGIYSSDGDIEALEGFVTDITERKEVTQELRTERDFINQALDSLDDLFYVVGQDGEIRRWNRRLPEVTGYTDDEIAEMGAVDFFQEDDQARISGAIEETMETGSDVVEAELLTADGDTIPYEFTGARLTDTDGNLVGLVGIGRDVSERKERERELERQREHLAALNSLNHVVRDITDAVIEQSTREEIQRVACEKLASSDSYTFAWIVEVEPNTRREVRSHTEVGVDRYLDRVELDTESESTVGEGIAERTFKTGDAWISQDVFEENDEPVQNVAAEYGFTSFATIPIVHDETQYGVLGIHSERTDAFAGEERELVTQLGEIIGYALYALERKEVLGSAIELEFRSERIAEPFLDRTGEDSTLTLESVVSLEDTAGLQYWTIDGMQAKAFRAAIEELPSVSDSRLLSTVGDIARVEVAVDGESIGSVFAVHDGELQSMRLEEDSIVFVGEFPETIDVEVIIEGLRETYPDVELVSQRRILTPRYLRRMVDENLTERQKTVLKLAYFGDYFSRPRRSTGEELADNLGITKQTFHHHRRNAESTVFRLLFEDPDDPLI